MQNSEFSMGDDADDQELLDGYYVVGRRLPDGRLAAVQDRGRTSILVVGLAQWTYDRHW